MVVPRDAGSMKCHHISTSRRSSTAAVNIISQAALVGQIGGREKKELEKHLGRGL